MTIQTPKYGQPDATSLLVDRINPAGVYVGFEVSTPNASTIRLSPGHPRLNLNVSTSSDTDVQPQLVSIAKTGQGVTITTDEVIDLSGYAPASAGLYRVDAIILTHNYALNPTGVTGTYSIIGGAGQPTSELAYANRPSLLSLPRTTLLGHIYIQPSATDLTNGVSIVINRVDQATYLEYAGLSTSVGPRQVDGGISALGATSGFPPQTITGGLEGLRLRVNSEMSAMRTLIDLVIPSGVTVAIDEDPTPYFDPTGLGLVNGKYRFWALCNGQNGTKDLRGRNIVGYDETTSTSPTNVSGQPTEAGKQILNYGAIGNTGGNTKRSIDNSQMPSHNHGGITGTPDRSLDHAHTYQKPVVVGGSGLSGSSAGLTDNTFDTYGVALGDLPNLNDHKHSIFPQGEGLDFDIRQPYTVLTYITYKGRF